MSTWDILCKKGPYIKSCYQFKPKILCKILNYYQILVNLQKV